MKTTGKNVEPGDNTKNKQTEVDDRDSLIANLASKESIVRIKARASLVSLGHQSVGPLLKALSSRNQWVRWEAAKALSQIHDPSSVNGLVRALRDKTFDVRWLAAEGLIAIGRKSIVPLLQALVDYSDSVWMREGAHHVLHELCRGDIKQVLQPVLAALEDIETPVEVPFIAKKALDRMEGK
jgi:HEAT repeat protein